MEAMSEIMEAQRQLLKRRKDSLVKHQSKIPKKPRQQKLRIFQGGILVPNNIFEAMMTDPTLTQRELKIIMFILRLTIGLNTRQTTLINRDFGCVVDEHHSQKIIESLTTKNWLTKTTLPSGTVLYEVSKDRFLNMQRDSQLSHQICKQMRENGVWRKK